MPKATLTPKTKQQKQIDQMEKAIYRIEQDTILLRKELKEHIENIWEVYKPLKKLSLVSELLVRDLDIKRPVNIKSVAIRDFKLIIDEKLFLRSFKRYIPHAINIITQIKTKTSLFNIPQPWTKSTFDKNLKAKANSIKPKTTFTEFVHEPDFGSLVNTFGKKANRVNGTERAIPKPNIP